MAEFSTPAPTALAKGALRRLAQAHLEPTPENYAKAYVEEAGGSAVAVPARERAPAWSALIERLVRNLERGSKQWTAARRKESLHRVLDGSGSDPVRLAARLQSLLQAWETDRPPEVGASSDRPPEAAAASDRPPEASAAADDVPPEVGVTAEVPHGVADAAGSAMPTAPEDVAHTEIARALNATVRAGLGAAEERAAELGRRFAVLAERMSGEGATHALAGTLGEAAIEAQRWFGQRHELVRQLTAPCMEMTHGLVELSEDETWAQAQSEALRQQLGQGIDVSSLRTASAVLADTRARQGRVKRERQSAREALKQLLAGMIGEVGALHQQAGGFESAIERHAASVEAADSLESLAEVVQTMLAESRRIRAAIGASQERLQQDGARAGALEARVHELEGEMRRLSDEASTDALTQVANRRGLDQAFAGECARAQREGTPLALGLLDIDNFKRLNDRLGHAAGDTALKALAAGVRERLRPTDSVARFGGEEFVVLMQGLPLDAAQQALTRLQRSLSASLFLHEGEEVFVTFSAGVTLWRPGETLAACVERADAGLYEAKGTGKNRTCAV